jgi:hypothetical protein
MAVPRAAKGLLWDANQPLREAQDVKTVLLEYYCPMKSLWRSVLLVLIPMFFSSCPVEKPELIAFDTDLRILRGSWTANILDSADYHVTKTADLSLIATYVDASSYLVSGSFQIPGEAALVVQGLVKGNTAQSFTRTSQIPPKALAELLLSSTVGQAATQVLVICPYAQQVQGQWQYQARLEPVTANRIPFYYCFWNSPNAQPAFMTRKP